MMKASRTPGSEERKQHKEGEKKESKQGKDAERPGLALPESETGWHMGGGGRDRAAGAGDADPVRGVRTQL